MGAVLALTAGPATAGRSGKVEFERNATSAFAIPWLTESSPGQRNWMRRRYHRMRGYTPFHDQALSWGPPTSFYRDLYAIYRDVSEDQQLMQQHPEWVLRNGQGQKLFIPWGCGGGSCPAYAADIGNPAWRAHWVSMAVNDLGKGYDGVFIDNVNMDLMVGNGDGDLVRPIDPRTGQPMTEGSWRRYVAEFTEEIRAALPGVRITHNAGQWWAPESSPFVRRQVQAADVIELERGFNDPGLTKGNGRFGFSTYLRHVDWLHKRGAAFVVEPYGLKRKQAEFELASYFLVDKGADMIASDYRADPDNWWRGWQTNLGRPRGKRRRYDGVLRRDFSRGVVLVNPPGRAQRVRVPSGHRWKRLGGGTVRGKVKLRGRQGLVLKRG